MDESDILGLVQGTVTGVILIVATVMLMAVAYPVLIL